jgi:hypothetical protein
MENRNWKIEGTVMAKKKRTKNRHHAKRRSKKKRQLRAKGYSHPPRKKK